MHPYIFAGLDPQKQAFTAVKLIPGWMPSTKELRAEAAQMIVADLYGITVEELKNPPDRRMMFVEARSMIYFYLRMVDNYTYKRIGEIFKRDHSSVVHNVKKFKHALSVKHSPERVGYIHLLNECGHIPKLLINTVPGSQYLDSIFDRQAYKEFFALNLARYDDFDKAHTKRLLTAKIKGDKDWFDNTVSTYYTRIKQNNLSDLYHRSYKVHTR